MMMLMLAVVVILGSGYWFFYQRRRAGAKSVPGPRPWPFIGNALQLDSSKFHVEIYRLAEEHGEMFQLNMLGLKYLMLNSQDLFETVLRKYVCRPQTIANTINFNGNGVDFTNNEFLVDEMKRVCHVISGDKIMQELFEEEVKNLLDSLKSSGDKEVALNATMQASVDAYILRALLGCKPGEEELKAPTAILKAYADIFGGITGVVLTSMPWLRLVPGPLKRLFDDSKTSLESIVDTLMETIRSGRGNGRGILENLMARKQELDGEKKENEKLIDENIHAFIIDIVVGSVAGMAKYMIATILCILRHQSVQDKLHAELDRVCSTTPPDETTRDQLHYLNAVLLEARRYSSTLVVTLPHTCTEDTEINGFFVEKGTQIFGNMFYINHAGKTWGDAWEFRPERFLDSSGKLLPSNHPLRESVKTFGTGRRYCKGGTIAEVAMFRYISAIMYNFNILPPADGQLPDCDPRTFVFKPVLTPPDVRCRLQLRHKK